MSMQTLTWDVDVAAGNSDAYGLALATQARQKSLRLSEVFFHFWGSEQVYK